MSLAWRGLLWARINLDLIGASLALVGAILVGVVVIVWAQRWWRKPADLLRPDEELDQYEGLAERGVLSAEEFARIRSTLEPFDSPGAEPEPHNREGIKSASPSAFSASRPAPRVDQEQAAPRDPPAPPPA